MFCIVIVDYLLVKIITIINYTKGVINNKNNKGHRAEETLVSLRFVAVNVKNVFNIISKVTLL